MNMTSFRSHPALQPNDHHSTILNKGGLAADYPVRCRVRGDPAIHHTWEALSRRSGSLKNCARQRRRLSRDILSALPGRTARQYGQCYVTSNKGHKERQSERRAGPVREDTTRRSNYGSQINYRLWKGLYHLLLSIFGCGFSCWF
jgi:hypothetical protein